MVDEQLTFVQGTSANLVCRAMCSLPDLLSVFAMQSPDDADFLALAFRSTLQAVLQEAHDDMKYEQVMEYHLQEQQTSTPAVVRLLEAAAALGRRNSNKSLQGGAASLKDFVGLFAAV